MGSRKPRRANFLAGFRPNQDWPIPCDQARTSCAASHSGGIVTFVDNLASPYKSNRLGFANRGSLRDDYNRKSTQKFMQPTRNALVSLIKVAACAILTIGLVAQARAEDKKTDPTGTWTWTVDRNGQTSTQTLKLKLDGGKLTGAIAGRNSNPDTEIADGKIDGDNLSFSVTRERNGNKMTQKFSGKLDGDTIKGKIEFDRNGTPASRDWEAKRGGDSAK